MENAQALSPGTQNLYYSSLDFLSLAGLDGSPGATHDFESPTGAVGDASAAASASASASHSRNHSFSQSHAHGGHGGRDGAGHGSQGDPDTPLDDPSPISLEPHHHSHSHSHSQSSSHAHHTSHNNNNHRMDDHQASGSGGHSSGHGGQQHVPGSGHNTPSLDASNEYANMDVSGSAYDAMQAGMLQHQLESIHMQSPFFGATNPQSPYGAMAQMFLTSPPAQSSSSSSQQPEAASQGALPEHRPHMPQRKFSAQSVLAGVGLLTPGPSGEMLPDVRMDLMSPMQLEMLARSEMIEGMDNFNGALLLSPALSHHTNSNYASPVSQVAFHSGGQLNANRHALEKLQQQQRQFQEQLALLQEQQRQLQATAAAVAASSGSPYLSAQHNQQRHSGLNQGGASGSGHSAGSISTPSPGSYFSPLTSPALEPAVSRSAALRAAAAHLSPGLHSQHHRQPHPLSALSSPALNPVGSSGGAQQTLSPALAPQNDTEVDGDYLSALQGFLDGAGGPSDATHQGSPVIGPSNPSPAIGASGSTGPHRGSLPAKSRPSPMMKPTHHRSHGRHGSNSVTTSPMAFKIPSSSQAGMGFLPPAAIDQRGVQQHQQQQQQQQHAASDSSTPSPVDLALIMPPPPVPPPGGRPKSLMPMTPASLMNLKADGEPRQGGPSAETSPVAQNAASSSSAQPARPVAAAKKPTPPVINVPKRGSRLVPSGGAAAAKRALAIRPPGGVGVRAAAKNAAAAAAANAEPETRRTSHKAAEQKRRDSLKAGFDELRLLLPPINTEALDPESGEPIPGSSAPRLLPKSSLVPDDNPNRGVSKVALLKFSNEYIVRLHDKVEKRDAYIDKLRDEVRRLRGLGDPDAAEDEVRGDEGEDLLEMDMLEGEEDDLGSDEDDDDMEVDDDRPAIPAPSQQTRKKGGAVGKSPHLGPTKRPSRSTSGASSAKSSRRVSASGAGD